MRRHMPSYNYLCLTFFITFILFTLCPLTTFQPSTLVAGLPRTNPAPRITQPRHAPSTASTPSDSRQDAAEILRLMVNYLEGDDAQAATSTYSSTRRPTAAENEISPLQLTFTHVYEFITAAYLPVDWLIHIAHHGIDSTDQPPHPFQPSYEAVRTLFGWSQPVNQTKTTASQSPHQQHHGQQFNQVREMATTTIAAVAATPTEYIALWSPSFESNPSSAAVNTTFPIYCVNCTIFTAPAVGFTILDGSAQDGRDFTLVSRSPLPFTTYGPSIPGPPPRRKKISVMEGDLIIQTLARAGDPYASIEARLESIVPRNFTMQIQNGVQQSDGSAIVIRNNNFTAPATYGSSTSTNVRIHSLVLPSIYFNQSVVIVDDLTSYAIFSVSCAHCGLVNVNLVLQTNLTDNSAPGVSGQAYQDLYGIGEFAPRVPINIFINFTVNVQDNPLPTDQPDLSPEGWALRNSSDVFVTWLDPISFVQPNELQRVNFAVHLSPLRYYPTNRTLAWAPITQNINDVENGLPATISPVSTAQIVDGAVNQSVPIVILNNPSLGQYPFTTLLIEPTIYCSTSGKIANASRTLYSCNTSSDDASRSQSYADYLDEKYGALIDVFQSDPYVRLDPSITTQTQEADVWAWFQNDPDGQAFFQQAMGDEGAGQNQTVQDELLFDACSQLITNVTMSIPPFSFNSTLTQYCQLSQRCYQRNNFCHSWVDTVQFCICPYDRIGDHCESFQIYHCDIRLVYPRMDDQHYEDDLGNTLTTSCPTPSSFRSHLPSTTDNPGSNSSVKLLPQTDLQSKYKYLPHLDGDPPCLEYPSTFNNPSIANPDSNTNPTGTQEFRFTVDCMFTTDDDFWGSVVADYLIPGFFLNMAQWTHIKQAPSDNVLAFLTNGNYTWDQDYDALNWTYEAIRITENGQIKFAVSLMKENPFQLEVHPQNFAHVSDTSMDQYTDYINVTQLTALPSADLINRATSTGSPSLLSNSTLGVRFNLTTFPAGYWKGGRYFIETRIKEYQGHDIEMMRVLNYPRGLVNNEYPARLFIEQSTYELLPPQVVHPIPMLGIFLLVLLGIGIVGAIYKYYEYYREEEFRKLVKTNKLRAQRRQAELDKEARRRLNRTDDDESEGKEESKM